MSEFTEVDTILFDMDGTLTDLKKRWWDPFFRAFYQLKPDVEEKIVVEGFEQNIGNIINSIGGKSKFVNFQVFWKITGIMQLSLIERFKMIRILRSDPTAFKEIQPVDGAKDTVSTLKQRGYTLALVTSASDKTITLAKQNIDFFDLFDVIITRNDVSKTKPDPEPILLATNFLSKNPEMCVMIGDFPVDIEAGKNAGTKTIGIVGPNGQYTRDLLVKSNPDLLLNLIKEILEHFP